MSLICGSGLPGSWGVAEGEQGRLGVCAVSYWGAAMGCLSTTWGASWCGVVGTRILAPALPPVSHTAWRRKRSSLVIALKVVKYELTVILSEGDSFIYELFLEHLLCA